MNETVQKMIEEQGGLWEQVRDRTTKDRDNDVIISFDCLMAYRLSLETGAHHPYWTVKYEDLRPEEVGEFFAAFGSHWQLLLSSLIKTSDGICKIRAFIKNGRKTGSWSISIDTKSNEAIADAYISSVAKS